MSDPTSIGGRLGPFTLTALLGKGGMGAVYRAEDASGRAVALKVLIGELSNDPRYVERFRREAQAAEAVAHRNVVACVGSGEDAGTLWIAFELVGGGTLKELVRARQRLPWAEAAKLGAQVARGLAAIHAKGLVHRDMKPANVLLDEQGVAKVGDLGLARGLVGKQTLTMSGELVGTFEYVAPEQTEHAKVDFRADLYSFGALLYELVTGRPPFTGAGMALIAQHISAVAKAPRELVKELPDELDALIRRLLSKQPEARGESALAVAAELEEIAASKARSRSRAIVVGACAAAAVSFLAGLGAFLTTLTPPVPPDVATVASASSPVKQPLARVDPRERPSWWAGMLEGDRPGHPLPDGLGYGPNPGEYVNLKDGSILVYVPRGMFRMGDDDGVGDANPNPPHDVTLSPFFIGKLEVTNAQFRLFHEEQPVGTTGAVMALVGDTGAVDWADAPTATWLKPDGQHACDPRHPVVQVVWSDAEKYARWMGLRLPTEAEWECAASWDHHLKKKFKYLDDLEHLPSPYANIRDRAFTRWFKVPDGLGPSAVDDGYALTSPVGHYKALVSPNGTYDQIGNAWELCADTFQPTYWQQPDTPAVNPLSTKPDPTGAHIARGGSWDQVNPRLTRRSRDLTGGVKDGKDALFPTTGSVGFRVARSAE